MFADQVEVELKAGRGGAGRLSFRHERGREKGGPDGGDGGRGGDIVFVVDHNLNTLSKYRTAKIIRAEAGRPGGTNRRRGKSGEDAAVPVPPGTVVTEDDRVIADLVRDGQRQVIAWGGRGGFGNAHFTASARQAPRIAEVGEPGETKRVMLELKLVADIGLVGLPNAGKSTLLSVITSAKPEIADYPFTTVIPNLGVADFEDDSFLVADIPGLIEGASRGKGLGDEFLRHIERTAVLLHLIDINEPDPAAAWQTIQDELRSYRIDLTDRPQLTVLTKVETAEPAVVRRAKDKLREISGRPVYPISAVAHRGLEELLRAAAKPVQQARRERAEAARERELVIDQTALPDLWRIEKEGQGRWRLLGRRIEGFARRTDWDNPEAVARLRDIMRKTGVVKELTRLGVQTGDKIKVGPNELEW